MGQLASQTDEALLQSAINGLEEAWIELVNRYHEKGLGWIRRQVDDPHLAQDIIQNLWLTLVQAVRRQQPNSFGALFWALLKRRLIDELRKKGRSKEAITLDAPIESAHSESTTLLDRQVNTSPLPLDEMLRSEEEHMLSQAMALLPDHYRVAIVARQIEGRSNQETARLLIAQGLVSDDGNVEKRVENYYYRGLKELKRQLQALEYNGGRGAV